MIIDAVVFGMIDVAELRRLCRVTRFDFWIAVSAIVGVLTVGVLAGVAIGVALSLGWLLYVATRPPMPLLGRAAGTLVFRDLAEHPETSRSRRVAVLRFDGGLFFATAEALEDRVRELADGPPPTALVLDLEGVNFIDSQGSAKLTDLHELSTPKAAPSDWPGSGRRSGAVLEARPVHRAPRADHVHGNVHRAVEAQLADAATLSRRGQPEANARRLTPRSYADGISRTRAVAPGVYAPGCRARRQRQPIEASR